MDSDKTDWRSSITRALPWPTMRAHMHKGVDVRHAETYEVRHASRKASAVRAAQLWPCPVEEEALPPSYRAALFEGSKR